MNTNAAKGSGVDGQMSTLCGSVAGNGSRDASATRLRFWAALGSRPSLLAITVETLESGFPPEQLESVPRENIRVSLPF
jgi:hypothetical protein